MLSYTFKNSHSQVSDPGSEGPLVYHYDWIEMQGAAKQLADASN